MSAPTTSTTTPAAVVERYLAAWNEPDAAARRPLVEAAFAPGITYADPMFAARGHDEVDAMVGGVHTAYAGCRFALTGEVESSHNRLLWHWSLVRPDGTAVAHGLDVAVVDTDGRLTDVSGFFRPA